MSLTSRRSCARIYSDNEHTGNLVCSITNRERGKAKLGDEIPRLLPCRHALPHPTLPRSLALTSESLIVDPEFAAIIPPLTEEELSALETSLVAGGCRDALVVWHDHDILLDGHNRLAICRKQGIEYRTASVALPDRASAKVWIITNQFARRNLTPYQRAELALELEPVYAEQAKERQRAGGVEKVPQKSAEAITETRERVAKQAGVSRDTIAKVKVIREKASDEVKSKLRSGEPGMSINSEYLIAAGKATPHTPHVSRNSGENEWYTPPEYVEAARLVMGSIDCDPASSPIANTTVKATVFFTAEEDGLYQKWGQNTFTNPPYSQPLIGKFVDGLIARLEVGEVKQAVVLVNNATETTFFQKLLYKASAICFPKGRIRFLDPEGNPSGTPLQGQAILYFGRCNEVFCDVFSQFGHTSCWFAKETIDE